MPALTNHLEEQFAAATVAFGSHDAAYKHVFGVADRARAYKLMCEPLVAVRIQELLKADAAANDMFDLVTLRSARSEYEDIRDMAKLAGSFGDAIKAQDRIVDLSKSAPKKDPEEKIYRFIFQTPPGVSNLQEWQQLTGVRPVIEHPPIDAEPVLIKNGTQRD